MARKSEEQEGRSAAGGDRPAGPHVPRDKFVGQLVEDPAQPPRTVLLTGFVGDSSEEGHTRIYLDPELSRYVDVPDGAILHSEPLPRESSRLGGSHVWVRADAQLRPGQAGARAGAGPNAAGFLQGQLMTEHLGGAAFGPGGGPIGKTGWQGCQPVSDQICIPNTAAGCHSEIFPCLGPTILKPQCWNTLIGPGCRTNIDPVCTSGCNVPQEPWRPMGGGQPFAAAGGVGGPVGPTLLGPNCQTLFGPDCWKTLFGPGCRTNIDPVCTSACNVPQEPWRPMGGGQPFAAAGGAGGPVGQTGWQGCGQPIGQTGWQGCGQPIGQTGWQGCGQPIGQTGWQGCGQPIGQTGWQGCGQPIGQTGWYGCGGGGAW